MTADVSFFAPQARLVDSTSGQVLALSATAKTSLGDRTDAVTTVTDLISVRVTLLASGTSTVSVVLNNQRRRDGQLDPGFPPWKYNDLQTFKFGTQLRVDLRYAGHGDEKNAPWRPMIHARITDMAFTFPQSGPATVTLSGEDFLSLLKPTPDESRSFKAADKPNEELLFTDALKRAGWKYGTPAIDVPKFTEPLTQVSHQKGTSYLQFLQTYADRLDCEIFVDNHVEKAKDVAVHFARARSRKDAQTPPLPGIEPSQRVPILEWGKNLIEFTPKLQVWDQYTKITYKGAHPTQRKDVKDSVGPEAVDVDLKGLADGDPPALNAVEVRKRYFEDGQSEKDPGLEVSNVDDGRARAWAEATLLKKARELLTAEASTIGLPTLRAGGFVKLTRLRPPFDGLYYVTQTVHSFDSNGYRTQLSVRRPWMLDPQKYLQERGSPR